jgi:hypothetical protein
MANEESGDAADPKPADANPAAEKPAEAKPAAKKKKPAAKPEKGEAKADKAEAKPAKKPGKKGAWSGPDPDESLGAALDRLVRGKKPSAPHASEGAHQEASALVAGVAQHPDVFGALDRAIAAKPKRATMMVFVLCDLLEVDGALERIERDLEFLEPDARRQIATALGNKHDARFLPLLDVLATKDRDSSVQAQAYQSISQQTPELIGQSAAFRALLPEPPTPRAWIALWGLRKGGFPQARPFLQRNFGDETQKPETRVVAAWGLASLGDGAALAYLGKQLEQDGSIAMRAAQAICDLKKWPFTWGGEQQLPEVRERWKKEAP